MMNKVVRDDKYIELDNNGLDYLVKIEQENYRLKEIEKEHQKINGELREEIKKFQKNYTTKENHSKDEIEEPKKIEKLDVALLGQCDNWLRCPTNKVTKQDIELNPYIIDNIRENTLYFQRKINELIDVVNEIKRG